MRVGADDDNNDFYRILSLVEKRGIRNFPKGIFPVVNITNLLGIGTLLSVVIREAPFRGYIPLRNISGKETD